MEREALEGANRKTAVLNTMSEAAKALKSAHQSLDIDKVQYMLDDIVEQQDLAKEISDAISNPLSFGQGLDEDELERESEELEQEDLDKALLNVGPTVNPATDETEDVRTNRKSGSASVTRVTVQRGKKRDGMRWPNNLHQCMFTEHWESIKHGMSDSEGENFKKAYFKKYGREERQFRRQHRKRDELCKMKKTKRTKKNNLLKHTILDTIAEVPLTIGLIRTLLLISGIEINPGPKGSNKFKSVEFIDDEDSDVDFDLSKKTKVTKYQKLAHVCKSCNYKTDIKSNLTRHEKNCTGKPLGSLCCPQGNCDHAFRTLKDLDYHLSSMHNLIIETEDLKFNNEVDLKQWLTELQSKESLRYVARSEKESNSYILHCHRSGQFARKSRSTGQRHPKKIGSVKSDHICASRLKVHEQSDGIRVTYFKTHTGHTISPGHVGLTSPLKRKICDELTQGVPKLRILENIRSDFRGEVTRATLTNMKDVANISQKYKINHAVKLDENDATSIQATIEKLRLEGDSGVFIYKQQGKESEEFPDLPIDDFMLGYMSKAQEDLLQLFGKEIVCFDGTHGTNGYGFEMSTLLTVDDQHQGFPLLFFFHSSKSHETYDWLFKKLNERVGVIKSRVFMSDSRCVHRGFSPF